MPATDSLGTSLLNLLFLNSDFANIGDAGGLSGSGAAGSLEISLHTATLTDASIQTTSEADYTGYARVSVARSSAEWTVSGDTVDNDNAITFPAATGGSNTVTYFGIGSAVAATTLWIYGALDSSLVVSDTKQPQFSAGTLDISVT